MSEGRSEKLKRWEDRIKEMAGKDLARASQIMQWSSWQDGVLPQLIWGEWHDRVSRVACRVAGRRIIPYQRPDFVAQCVLKAYENLGKFHRQKKGTFEGWLYRLVSHAATDWNRANNPIQAEEASAKDTGKAGNGTIKAGKERKTERKMRRRRPVQLSIERLLETLGTPDNAPKEAFEVLEALAVVDYAEVQILQRRALSLVERELGPKARQALQLKLVSPHLKCTDIASMIGLSGKEVRRLFKLIRDLFSNTDGWRELCPHPAQS